MHRVRGLAARDASRVGATAGARDRLPVAGPRKSPYLFYVAAAAALLIGAVVLGLLVIALAGQPGGLPDWWPDLSLEEMEQAIRSAGPWGVAVAMGLMVLHCFVPFPAELVALANGMIYGPLWGTAITWSGAMLGAMLSFGLARVLGRPFLRRVLHDADVRRIDRWVQSHGAGAVFVGRFVPVISFNLINYAAGLTRISWWTFAWATGLGILPLTSLMVVLGHRMELMPWHWWPALLFGGALLWLVVHRLRRSSTSRPDGRG